MSGELSVYGKQLVHNLAFRDAATPPTTLYLGLATASIEPDDSLDDIQEEDDDNYSRVEITFTSPAEEGSTGDYYIENDEDEIFPTYDDDPDLEVTWAFLTEESSGTSGDWVISFELDSGVLGEAGGAIEVPQGDLTITLPAGGS